MNIRSLALQKFLRNMSPRPKRFRRMPQPPFLKGFKPFGIRAEINESVNLLFEEYEAIKLADYESLSQEEAAKKMDVSRPTFTRIYESARKKIAKAFTESLSIIIEGGNVDFEDNWYKCDDCDSTFRKPKISEILKKCPVCNSSNIEHINESLRTVKDNTNFGIGSRMKGMGYCVCPKCNTRIEHRAGVPCRNLICEKCGVSMIREGSAYFRQIKRK